MTEKYIVIDNGKDNIDFFLYAMQHAKKLVIFSGF